MTQCTRQRTKRERDRDSYLRRRQARQKAGLCLQCGQQPPVTGLTKCQECRDTERGVYKRLKSKGVCPRCCTNPRVPGRTLCGSCRHKDQIRARQPGQCTKCGATNGNGKRHCNSCLARVRGRNDVIRKQVLDHYGNACACCGESTYEFLQIDHIANNGAEHRRTIGKGIYGWLIRNNYPPGFQILCANCNLAKAHYGHCPHQDGVTKHDVPAPNDRRSQGRPAGA